MAEEAGSRITWQPASPLMAPCRVNLNLLTMRVFLRNKQTRLYCASSNDWADAISRALPFSSVPHAARFAFDQKIPEAEIVLRSDLVEHEVALPLLPQWCDIDASGHVPH